MSARLKLPIPVTKNNNKQNQGTEAKFNELILILNPNSQGGVLERTGMIHMIKLKNFSQGSIE